MRPSFVFIAIVLSGLVGFTAGWLWGSRIKAQPAQAGAHKAAVGCGCDTGATTPASSALPAAPAIPTGSGRACLAVFVLAEQTLSQKVRTAVGQFEKQIKEKKDITPQLDIVYVEAKKFPALAQKWRLRMAPTILLVDAQGKELWRHEGALSAKELLTQLRSRGFFPSSAKSK